MKPVPIVCVQSVRRKRSEIKDQSSTIKLTIEHGEIAHAELVDESIAQRERTGCARDVA